MEIPKRPIKITVCADGFVSIMQDPKERRLKAALPCYSAWTIAEALDLISKVCVLRPCLHGGKTGMTVEAKAPGWPEGGTDDISNISKLNALFHEADSHNKRINAEEDAREKYKSNFTDGDL